jgi:transposase-like protein
MTKERRKFTAEDRLSILKEAEREGRSNTLRKYNAKQALELEVKSEL